MAVSETAGMNRWQQVRDCLLAIAFCVACSFVFCYLATSGLAAAGIIRNYGLARLPTSLLSSADAGMLALVATGVAGSLMGLMLYVWPTHPKVALIGAFMPWGMSAWVSLWTTPLDGVWYRSILSSGGYLALALGQWAACRGALWVFHRLRRSRLHTGNELATLPD